jgi:hypothetical protein
VGGSWRLAARATAACSLMRDVTRGSGDASQQYVRHGCPVGNAASLVGEAVRRLSRQCGVRCEEGLLELRRWAGEIILKAIAVPGLFLLMRRLYCTATWAPLVYVEVVGLRHRLPQRVGACGVHAGEGVCGVCAEEGAGGSAPCWYMLRPLWRIGAASGLGLSRRPSPGSSIIAAGGVCGYLASLRRLSARLGGRGGLGFWRPPCVSALACLGGRRLGASSV